MTAGFNSEQPVVKDKVKIKLRLLIRCVELWERTRLSWIVMETQSLNFVLFLFD